MTNNTVEGRREKKTKGIIIFENKEMKLEVNLKDETVWLTQSQMAELFNKGRKTVAQK